MVQAELTTKEAAERIGVPTSTLKNWVTRLPVPSHLDSQGNRRFTAEALEVLERVRALRLDENRGYDTIRRVLEPVPAQGQPQTEPSITKDESQTNQRPAQDTEVIVAQVIAAMDARTELAEKYARAAHQIGGLEKEVEHQAQRIAELTAKNEELENQVKLLMAPKEPEKPSRPWWKLW